MTDQQMKYSQQTLHLEIIFSLLESNQMTGCLERHDLDGN